MCDAYNSNSSARLPRMGRVLCRFAKACKVSMINDLEVVVGWMGGH